MVRLRVILGVASSLVAVAALSIVLAGNGEAQSNGNGPNVFVTNGNVSANIINPATNPVLIRDVDAQGAKELWQTNSQEFVFDGADISEIEFPEVPAGKTLVVEHVNIAFQAHSPQFPFDGADLFVVRQFGGGNQDAQIFLPQQAPGYSVTDAPTKFYVPSGASLRVVMLRRNTTGAATTSATATGYLVNYP